MAVEAEKSVSRPVLGGLATAPVGGRLLGRSLLAAPLVCAW